MARPSRGDIQWFNLRQRRTTADVPTTMQAAFAAAGPPKETPEGATSGAVQDAGEAKLHGDGNTLAGGWKPAHLAAAEALLALYGRREGEP